jgi:RND superfamily putative drug exporter
VVYPRGDNHFRKPAAPRPPNAGDEDTAVIPVTTG